MLFAQNTDFIQLAHGTLQNDVTSVESITGASQITFSNPVIRAVLGTESGWGLLLVMSLIVIGQSFEYLKKVAVKSLPDRYDKFTRFTNYSFSPTIH